MTASQSLLDKYNKEGPRYTSYPPVPFWNNDLTESKWIEHLKEGHDPARGIDLYVHIPFCESLCYYCGCSRTITKNHAVEDNYLSLLFKEWDLYTKRLGFNPKINSLHLGGGTPTFLSPTHLDEVIEYLAVNRTDAFIGSIEIDPRTCTREHIKVLVKRGISRVSLGIQDFDPEVQKSINRYQPVSLVEKIVQELRAQGINSINFDLIYGLPNQNLSTIRHTIQEVTKLDPDLIAFYSYAHLPEKIKNQRLINESDLPKTVLKRELYEQGKRLLKEQGYEEIGMDHFAKPTSYLYRSKIENKLKRNFMGYLDKKSNLLIGLGPTAISDSGQSFSQNEKDLKSYESKLSKGTLPLEKGHVHSKSDKEAQKIIMDLMCLEHAVVSMRDHLSEETLRELNEFEIDGIITYEGKKISVTERGKPFIRNVAMSFDHHLKAKKQEAKFSQTI